MKASIFSSIALLFCYSSVAVMGTSSSDSDSEPEIASKSDKTFRVAVSHMKQIKEDIEKAAKELSKAKVDVIGVVGYDEDDSDGKDLSKKLKELKYEIYKRGKDGRVMVASKSKLDSLEEDKVLVSKDPKWFKAVMGGEHKADKSGLDDFKKVAATATKEESPFYVYFVGHEKHGKIEVGTFKGIQKTEKTVKIADSKVEITYLDISGGTEDAAKKTDEKKESEGGLWNDYFWQWITLIILVVLCIVGAAVYFFVFKQ